MRKFGKYEKMRKNAILQTYITSLLCLVLCVTMFFGTSMAWFSDTAESTYNEMYVGTLEVELKHASFKNGELVLNDNKEMNAVEGDYKIFESGKKTETGIRWEPGYTAGEKFEVIEGEDNDLAFSYQMGINCDFVDTKNDNGEVTTSAAAKEKIAQAITVWNYLGDDAESIVELPKDFATMTAAGWEKVGTLYDVITNHLPVFEGEMNKEAVTATKKVGEETVDDPAKAYHLIALHMDENFDGAITKDAEGKITASVQGQTLNNITIKLVATQKPSEQDAFGGIYDAEANGSVVVRTNEELEAALNEGKSVYLVDGEYKMPSSGTTGIIKISGTKDAVLDMTMGAYLDNANVSIEGVTIKTGTGKANGNGSDYAALYTTNVTYTNCKFVGPMRVGRDGAKFINCTFTELGNDYVWTYGNDVTFVGCTFNTAGKAILIYSDGGSEISEVSVKNCVFNSTEGAKAGAIANQNCAAIEIHNYGNGVNLTTSGNTYDSNFSGEWRIKTYETGRTQIIVNGTEYTTIALDGKTMTIDANKNVTVNG